MCSTWITISRSVYKYDFPSTFIYALRCANSFPNVKYHRQEMYTFYSLMITFVYFPALLHGDDFLPSLILSNLHFKYHNHLKRLKATAK